MFVSGLVNASLVCMTLQNHITEIFMGHLINLSQVSWISKRCDAMTVTSHTSERYYTGVILGQRGERYIN